MNLRLLLIFFGWLQILPIHAQTQKAHQIYFKVDSEVSEQADSLFLARNTQQQEKINEHYEALMSMEVENFSVNDSLAYYLSTGLFQTLTYDLERATNSLFTAEILAEKYDKGVYQATVQNYLGNAYYFLKDNVKALEYYNLVAQNDSAKGSTRAAVLNNISVINYEYHQGETNPKSKDSLAKIITENYRAAVAIHLATNNYNSLTGTYSVMVPWFASTNKFDSAYVYVEKARDLCTTHDLDGRLAFLRISLAKVLIQDGIYLRALDTLDKAITYFQEIGDKDQEIHAIAVQTWAYDSLRDYKSSKELSKRMYALQQENFTDKKAKSIGEFEAKFNTQEKELENQKLLAENKNKELRLNRLILLSALLALLTLAVFLFYRNRLKRKQIEFKDQLIQSNMESEEKERKRIARELHDGVGQQISSIKLGLEGLDKSQKTSENVLTELKSMVTAVLDNVRGLSHQMMPVALQRFGLVKALESLVDFLNENGLINYSLDHFNSADLTLTEAQETHLYRIAQECANNINKHSGATEATIQLYKQGSNVILAITDNGSGFDQSQKNIGMGLMNIHSRVQALNGTLTIESEKGQTLFMIKM